MIDNERRSGRTTRLIDGFVQEFFKNGIVSIYDHHTAREDRVNNNLRRDNMKKVLRRLEYEHGISIEGRIYIDAKNFIIKWK